MSLLTTATAAAYEYRAGNALPLYALKRRKAQKQRGFRAKSTYGHCIKDEVLIDQAAGTGGMLTTAYEHLHALNPSATIHLFGQEIMGVSYAVGLAEMLIKGQNAENYVRCDTFKQDSFPNRKMRFCLENPPFGQPWGGKKAKTGQEQAVLKEYQKGFEGRWGAGLPGTGDAQLLFVQSAINKLDDQAGRAAIIENGSPLFTGGVPSGESQIRRWMLENDLIEAIIAMPTDMFYIIGNLKIVQSMDKIYYKVA